MKNLTKTMQKKGFNPRRIDDYKESLRYFRKDRLQEMILSLERDSKFSDLYSADELKTFEEQYGVPIKTGKDLQYLTFAVAEKLKKPFIKRKRESNKSEKNKLNKQTAIFLLVAESIVLMASVLPHLSLSPKQQLMKINEEKGIEYILESIPSTEYDNTKNYEIKDNEKYTYNQNE